MPGASCSASCSLAGSGRAAQACDFKLFFLAQSCSVHDMGLPTACCCLFSVQRGGHGPCVHTQRGGRCVCGHTATAFTKCCPTLLLLHPHHCHANNPSGLTRKERNNNQAPIAAGSSTTEAGGLWGVGGLRAACSGSSSKQQQRHAEPCSTQVAVRPLPAPWARSSCNERRAWRSRRRSVGVAGGRARPRHP